MFSDHWSWLLQWNAPIDYVHSMFTVVQVHERIMGQKGNFRALAAICEWDVCIKSSWLPIKSKKMWTIVMVTFEFFSWQHRVKLCRSLWKPTSNKFKCFIICLKRLLWNAHIPRARHYSLLTSVSWWQFHNSVKLLRTWKRGFQPAMISLMIIMGWDAYGFEQDVWNSIQPIS